jgi:hypothetical protein
MVIDVAVPLYEASRGFARLSVVVAAASAA